MSKYANANDGSNWQKWDLHIHTPETQLNDGYKCNVEENVWDKFIDTLEESDVAAFGITDYFSIENYKKFLALYKSKYPKSKKAFFPNIEFRLEASVNKKAEEVNIHVIFSNEVETLKIDDFLQRLPTNMQRNEVTIFCSQLTQQEIVSAAIDHKKIRKILETVFGKDKCYIIGAAVNDQGLRADTDSPRKKNISDDIERVCEFVFGSNKNHNYYLSPTRYDNGDFSPSKPVIAGCDAHSFDELTKYLGKHIETDGKYCTWIKAAPSFNGLRQILFEPENRIAIQAAEPDYKSFHNVIKKINIIDNGNIFGNRTIPLNKNLNAIIGGKSSGKSLLLYEIANSVDPEQVNKVSKRLNLESYHFENINFEIEWADDVTDKSKEIEVDLDSDVITKTHKITYIPQLYINHLAEKNNKQELNKFVGEILLQDQDYRAIKTGIEQKIEGINQSLVTSLNSLLQIRNEWIALADEKKSYGKSEDYDKELQQLTQIFSTLQINTTLTEPQIARYNELNKNLSAANNKITDLNNNSSLLNNIRNEIIASWTNLLGDSNKGLVGSIYKYSSKLSDTYIKTSSITTIISEGFQKLLSAYDAGIKNFNIETIVKTETANKTTIEEELSTYKDKLSQQSGLQGISDKIEKSKRNKLYAEDLDKKIVAISDNYKTTKRAVTALLRERNKEYIGLMHYINKNKSNIGSEIQLTCSIEYDINSFLLYKQMNKRVPNKNPWLQLNDAFVDFTLLPDFFEKLIKVENSFLIFTDKNHNIALRNDLNLETVFNGLIEDHLSFNYDVTYRGDNLLKMSPGKKGTVLLILFLELSSAINPILIDQPEDNLDNRTIYELLCKMIKSKKRERQIIIVTHNANLVVNTDTENVVIANQEGQEQNEEKQVNQFEYINGPIELSFIDNTIKNVLLQKGIKEHICDILEGGDEAFKMREKKYGL